ncbi:hypothetical protein G7046_g9342 [Stylonectria norvegica]|nr:hypothetical protein G7046_g9342 [Stylonectria norvegica]
MASNLPPSQQPWRPPPIDAATLLAIIIALFLTALLLSILSQLLARRKTRITTPPLSPATETRQLLLPPDCADPGERLPLHHGHARGPVYDTFQIAPPHATRLKVSRSMMELNGGGPLEMTDEDRRKSKTVHWHGVNRLNTAWGWMG